MTGQTLVHRTCSSCLWIGRWWPVSLLGMCVLMAASGPFADREARAESKEPDAQEAHFHHLHLNTVDPNVGKTACDNRPRTFSAKRGKVQRLSEAFEA